MASNNDLLSVFETLEQQDRKIAAIDEKLQHLQNTVEAQNKDISSRVDSILEKLEISPPAAAVDEDAQGLLNPVFERDDAEGGEMSPANGELCNSLFFQSIWKFTITWKRAHFIALFLLIFFIIVHFDFQILTPN